MQSVRSGSHLELIGETWYYRRVVPPDARAAFGKRTVRVSLKTKSHTEAKRLEKSEDVKFQDTLDRVRQTKPDGPWGDPEVRRHAIAHKMLCKSRPELAIYVAAFETDEQFEIAVSGLSQTDRTAVDQQLHEIK